MIRINLLPVRARKDGRLKGLKRRYLRTAEAVRRRSKNIPENRAAVLEAVRVAGDTRASLRSIIAAFADANKRSHANRFLHSGVTARHVLIDAINSAEVKVFPKGANITSTRVPGLRSLGQYEFELSEKGRENLESLAQGVDYDANDHERMRGGNFTRRPSIQELAKRTTRKFRWTVNGITAAALLWGVTSFFGGGGGTGTPLPSSTSGRNMGYMPQGGEVDSPVGMSIEDGVELNLNYDYLILSHNNSFLTLSESPDSGENGMVFSSMGGGHFAGPAGGVQISTEGSLISICIKGTDICETFAREQGTRGKTVYKKVKMAK